MLLRLPLAIIVATLLLGTACAGALHADDLMHPSGAAKNQPVMLTAREVGYDQKNSTAIALGHVEVVQDDNILLADRVTYNQKTGVVHANGHVSILQSTGDVFFADDAVLTDKMQKGVVKEFRARLKDNSLFASREARKIDQNVTKLHKSVYSPCHVCDPEPGKPADKPLWQVEADKATIDENIHRVSYRDAYIDVYGVPVIYTPYFSHPTPDAPNVSGLLTPQYFHATDLGNVVKEPVYITFAPNLDMTLTPWYMSGEKPLLEGEVRGMVPGGTFTAQGAITDTYNRDDGGNIIPGSEVRGYIDAKGKLQLDPYWDVGIDAERTSDTTFLQLYRFSWQDMLTSRLYAERLEDRSYVQVQSMAFQGLELQDVSSQSPYILPQALLHFESDPLAANSRLTFDSSALALERRQGDSDQRISSTLGWKLPYVTHGGQVFELDATARGDAYSVQDQTVNTATGETFDGQTGRFIPQIDANWKYPFISRFGDGGSIMIAPVVEATYSPNLNNSSNIPNEDSQVSELSDVNLFSPDRFAGLDQIESGARGVYGTRGQVQFSGDRYVEWLLGQAYQQNENSDFPLSTNNALTHFSDYIGRLAFKYRWMDVTYSFRADRDTLALTSNEVNTIFKLDPVSFDVTYGSYTNDPLFGSQQVIFGSSTVTLTPRWDWNVSGRENIGTAAEVVTNPALPISVTNPLEPSAGTVGLSSSLVYHNECIMVTTGVGRSYIDELDVKPSTTFSVMLTLKSFGNQGTGSNANNFGGASSVGLNAVGTAFNPTTKTTMGSPN